MLPNPTQSLQARQKHHRRQNSTSSAGQAMVPTTPTSRRVQPSSHRRGLSLDTRSRSMASISTPQDHRVSFCTNLGFTRQPQQQQYVPQEAQQQCLQARPGTHPDSLLLQQQLQLQQPQSLPLQWLGEQQQQQAYLCSNFDGSVYLNTPQSTPQACHFDPSPSFNCDPIPLNLLDHQHQALIQRNRISFGNNAMAPEEADVMLPDDGLVSAALQCPRALSVARWPSSGTVRRSQPKISTEIAGRVNRYEALGREGSQVPETPPEQNEIQYLPPTPMCTPHDRLNSNEQRVGRFTADYDEFMEETIKPTRNRAHQSTQNIFQDMRGQAEGGSAGPSPPRSGPLSCAAIFHTVQRPLSDSVNVGVLNEAMKRLSRNSFDALSETDHSVDVMDPSCVSGRDLQRSHSIDEAIDVGLPIGAPEGNRHSDEGPGTMRASSSASSHCRNGSQARMISADSIANLKIEETRTETGITLAEIAQHIKSPETTDGKWTCLFEDCGKKFGRKENIKSHVQTHLNDRQYQCPSCDKRFVRQHDLKRHAKIHTGVKPYPCQCGNTFARHDALTRHRQRGMCIGAFDGIVQRVFKRGRPRKTQPITEQKLTRAIRHSRHNLSFSSTSSASCLSDFSDAETPGTQLDILDDLVLGDNDVSIASVAAPVCSRNPPGAEEVVRSPSLASAEPPVSPEDLVEQIMSECSTPYQSGTSHCMTPPEDFLSPSPGPNLESTLHSDISLETSLVEPEVPVSASAVPIVTTEPASLGIEDDDPLFSIAGEGDLDMNTNFSQDSAMFMLDNLNESYDEAVMFQDAQEFFDVT